MLKRERERGIGDYVTDRYRGVSGSKEKGAIAKGDYWVERESGITGSKEKWGLQAQKRKGGYRISRELQARKKRGTTGSKKRKGQAGMTGSKEKGALMAQKRKGVNKVKMRIV